MKRYIQFFLVSGAILATVGTLTLHATARTLKKEKAVIEFTDDTRLQGVILRGKYLVVHDPDSMANGEACVFFYRYAEGDVIERLDGDKARLVVSFHCIPVQRKPTSQAVFTIAMSSDGTTAELKEIQLPDSPEAHRVPDKK